MVKHVTAVWRDRESNYSKYCCKGQLKGRFFDQSIGCLIGSGHCGLLLCIYDLTAVDYCCCPFSSLPSGSTEGHRARPDLSSSSRERRDYLAQLFTAPCPASWCHTICSTQYCLLLCIISWGLRMAEVQRQGSVGSKLYSSQSAG